MAGNVWEWTRSLFYDPRDGRENLEAGDDVSRVLRGGAFGNTEGIVRYGSCLGSPPNHRHRKRGFRVVVSPFRRAQHGDTSGI
jgi:formylglycine-generating enzyme required for sulfatase activity